MQHVYPDVIIVERGRGARQDDTLTSHYDEDTLKSDDTKTLMKLCHISDDDVNASLKDYTYMYKKEDDSDCTRPYYTDDRQTDEADHDAASDISSVTSSIVDYVRRSLSETESRDEQPPPLPVKTTTQRRAPLDKQQILDDVITSNWEPTHMTWDEVGYTLCM